MHVLLQSVSVRLLPLVCHLPGPELRRGLSADLLLGKELRGLRPVRSSSSSRSQAPMPTEET
ncbi:hypothetical protein [Streptomyces sp. WM6373]|uniref:hypothetical protein n=1 Tax=Streptomyces sp. WM6373 TaxID=1415556 RepID=UPI00131CF3A7|nr:hypothetical protein [Streptomyces sp. WM6373]